MACSNSSPKTSASMPAAKRKRDLLAVKFIHPGIECPPALIKRNKGWMPWNTGGHHRKFMRTSGEYLKNGIPVKADLCFWGEWEPDSQVTFFNGVDSPKQEHIPCLFIDKRTGKVIYNAHKSPTPKKGKKPQCCNTDPFVFNNPFYYFTCQQYSPKGNPTKLNSLAPGSLILFGSYRKINGVEYFGLDTVFVVSNEYRYFTNGNYQLDLKGFIPPRFAEISCFDRNKADLNKYCCYKGASCDNPFDGMYSFVPCKIADDPNKGFERVLLTEKDIADLAVRQTQSRKAIVINDRTKIKEVWDIVKSATAKQGFLEGIKFDYNIKLL